MVIFHSRNKDNIIFESTTSKKTYFISNDYIVFESATDN